MSDMLNELHTLIKTGQAEAAVALLDQHPELLDTPYPETLDPKQGTPLHQALASGNDEMITALLRCKPKQPNQLNKDGKTALALLPIWQSTKNEAFIYLPFFEAVNAGCVIDPHNIRSTNEACATLLDHLECIKGENATGEAFLEMLRSDLATYDVTQQLPNINKNPKAFCGYALTAATAAQLAHYNTTDERFQGDDIPPFILEAVQKQGFNWEKNLRELLDIGFDERLVEDAIWQFAQHVLEANAARKSFGGKSSWWDDEAGAISQTKASAFLKSNIALAIMQDRSITDIVEVAKAYHRHRNHLLHDPKEGIIEIDEDMIADATRKKAAIHDWPPLLVDKTEIEVPKEAFGDIALPKGVKSLRIVELTTRKALKAEGEKQHHCVESYKESCKDGECRIFSIRTDKGKILSTLEIDCSQLSIVQHKAQNNKNPSEICKLAAQWFEGALRNGTIARHTELEATDHELQKSPVPTFVLTIGYVPTKEKCEKAYDRFRALKTDQARQKSFLSPAYQHMTLEELDNAFQYTDHYNKALGLRKPQEIGVHELATWDRKVDQIKRVLKKGGRGG